MTCKTQSCVSRLEKNVTIAQQRPQTFHCIFNFRKENVLSRRHFLAAGFTGCDVLLIELPARRSAKSNISQHPILPNSLSRVPVSNLHYSHYSSSNFISKPSTPTAGVLKSLANALESGIYVLYFTLPGSCARCSLVFSLNQKFTLRAIDNVGIFGWRIRTCKSKQQQLQENQIFRLLINLRVEKLRTRMERRIRPRVSPNIKHTFPILGKCTLLIFRASTLKCENAFVAEKNNYHYIKTFFDAVRNFISFKLLLLDGDVC